MKSRNILDSFNYAFEGIIHAFKTQRNMKLHFMAMIAVLLAALVFKLSKTDMLIIFLVIAMVLVAEMFNTAIETVVDLCTQKPHPLAAIAKNVAAGAVLIAAIVAVVVGYLIFFPAIDPMIPRVITVLQNTPAHLTMIALLCTVVLVVAGKALTKRGTPVQGGMPSGHAALSTVAATVIAFICRNTLVVMLSAFLVVLVGESRIETKIHSWDEVLVGGILGFLVTLFVFQVMLYFS